MGLDLFDIDFCIFETIFLDEEGNCWRFFWVVIEEFILSSNSCLLLAALRVVHRVLAGDIVESAIDES